MAMEYYVGNILNRLNEEEKGLPAEECDYCGVWDAMEPCPVWNMPCQRPADGGNQD